MTRARCMAAHPAGVLTDEGIEARRVALDDEELGLVGLVPVDRVLAVAGGLIGGALTLAVALALEFHVRAVRRAQARER